MQLCHPIISRQHYMHSPALYSRDSLYSCEILEIPVIIPVIQEIKTALQALISVPLLLQYFRNIDSN